MDVLASRVLLCPTDPARSRHFYGDVLGLALLEMWIEDPDGVAIVLVEVPAEHPLRRDQRQ